MTLLIFTCLGSYGCTTPLASLPPYYFQRRNLPDFANQIRGKGPFTLWWMEGQPPKVEIKTSPSEFEPPTPLLQTVTNFVNKFLFLSPHSVALQGVWKFHFSPGGCRQPVVPLSFNVLTLRGFLLPEITCSSFNFQSPWEYFSFLDNFLCTPPLSQSKRTDLAQKCSNALET